MGLVLVGSGRESGTDGSPRRLEGRPGSGLASRDITANVIDFLVVRHPVPCELRYALLHEKAYTMPESGAGGRLTLAFVDVRVAFGPEFHAQGRPAQLECLAERGF